MDLGFSIKIPRQDKLIFKCKGSHSSINSSSTYTPSLSKNNYSFLRSPNIAFHKQSRIALF